MTVLKVDNLVKVYGKGEHQAPGSQRCLICRGLNQPDEGKVYVDGKGIFSLKEEALTIFRRRKIGFVFQSYNLVPVLSVYENVVLPVELDGKR